MTPFLYAFLLPVYAKKVKYTLLKKNFLLCYLLSSWGLRGILHPWGSCQGEFFILGGSCQGDFIMLRASCQGKFFIKGTKRSSMMKNSCETVPLSNKINIFPLETAALPRINIRVAERRKNNTIIQLLHTVLYVCILNNRSDINYSYKVAVKSDIISY